MRPTSADLDRPPAVAPPAGAATPFDALFAREYEAMVRVAFLILGSRPEAEDVAQDAFARLRVRNPISYDAS